MIDRIPSRQEYIDAILHALYTEAVAHGHKIGGWEWVGEANAWVAVCLRERCYTGIEFIPGKSVTILGERSCWGER